MPLIQIGDQRIFYNDTGTGEAVVFLHNGFYSTATWDCVRARFAEHFRVLDYDRFGYGKSDHYPDNGDIDGDIVEAGVSELTLFVDGLGLERISLVGHCLGGAIALLFANRHKERVRRVVASSVGFYGSIRSVIQTDMTFVPFDRIEQRLRRQMGAMHGEDYVERLWSIWSSNRQSYIMSDSYDIRPEVRRLRCPLLLINGDRDFYFEVEHPVSMFKKMRRNTSLWIVPGCGHDVHMEKPEEFVTTVTDFLKNRP
jgi:pimeloyl-ACP methyl ester carboxylesterase